VKCGEKINGFPSKIAGFLSESNPKLQFSSGTAALAVANHRQQQRRRRMFAGGIQR